MSAHSRTALSPAKITALLMLGAACLDVSPALGQTDSQPAIEEITVTARRVQEKLQDVPLAVTAFTAQTIQDFGLQSIRDISEFTPGFFFQNDFGRRDVSFASTIRGLSNINNANLSFSGVGYFVDGVAANNTLDDYDLSNVERVEIIRGPQSAQYGRGTEAGAINYITRKPGNSFEGALTASYASYNDVHVNGHLSGPVVMDKLFFTANGSYYNRDGDYTNAYNGEKLGKEDTKTVAASLLFTPIDAFDATARVGYVYDRDNQLPMGFVGRDKANCYVATDPYYCGVVPTNIAPNLDTTHEAFDGLRRHDVRGSLSMNYRMNDWTLSSITGYDVREEVDGNDGSYNATPTLPLSAFFGVPHGLITTYQSNDVTYSTELRLSSPEDQPVRGSLGAYYYIDSKKTGNIQDPTDQLFYGTTDAYQSGVRNQAIFGLISYTPVPLPDLTATFEMRAARDVISYSDHTKVVPVTAPHDVSRSFGNVTPRLTLDYKFTPDLLGYINIAKGTRPGGVNSLTVASSYIFFNEEKVWNYEVGVKSEWLEHRLQLNAALFYEDLTGQQLTANVVTNVGALTSVNTNVGKSHTEGLELEAHAKPMEHLGVNATYTYTYAVFDNFPGFQEFCTIAGVAAASPACLNTSLGNAAGKLFPNVPQHMASVSLDWTAPLYQEWKYFARPSVSYRSSVFDQAENLAETGDVTLVNLRMGVQTDTMSITAFGTNLTGETNSQYILRYVDFKYLSYPRAFVFAPQRKQQFGIELSGKF